MEKIPKAKILSVLVFFSRNASATRRVVCRSTQFLEFKLAYTVTRGQNVGFLAFKIIFFYQDFQLQATV